LISTYSYLRVYRNYYYGESKENYEKRKEKAFKKMDRLGLFQKLADLYFRGTVV
jgi:hypothetical protein